MTEKRSKESVGTEAMTALVVRGIRTTDELEGLGLPMARRYADADEVLLIGDDGRGTKVKGSQTATIVEFIDADSRLDKLGFCLSRLRASYVVDHSGRETESHSVVGFFLFYWMYEIDGKLWPIIDLIAAGEIDAVVAAAMIFIDSDYGANVEALRTEA